ncbi:MAG: hypothetical protein E6J90_50720 [Deltaproteobacteria bacterium]|nr:MAG: hypothetical protein E6J90_50720 [Deltaproteobacteria bacterium]
MSSRAALVIAMVVSPLLASAEPASHAAMRPLPVASARPAATGPVRHVDAARGDDAGDGSAKRPWKTLGAAVRHLAPGDTLYVHAGTYFESVTIALRGTEQAPITIRSAPGELAMKGGASGEFESVHAFPDVHRDADGGRGVWVVGNFADSLVPLHGYRFDADFRSDNPHWNVPGNTEPGAGIWLGPGVWFDWQSHRVHVRLAHTTGQPDNYTGETDPRKLALVIGLDRSALVLDRAAHVRIWDLVLRGSATRTVSIEAASHIELDGVTIYGGAPALYVGSTDHLRLVRSGISPYLFVAGSRAPQSRDWELAYSEFTDGHDGIVIDSVKHLAFHHNRIDNFNDDGIYLSLPPRVAPPEDVRIYENLVSRIYTTLAFAEADDHTPAPIGTGVYVYRNVFDLRDGTYTWIAKDASGAPTISASRLCGDHGSPTWEPLLFYHNTVVTAGPAVRDYYAAQLVMGTRGTRRRIFNNAFVQIEGNPGLNVPSPGDDLEADGNLLWGLKAGPAFHGDFFAARKARPGTLGAHDVFGDPRLAHVEAAGALDVRPAGGGVVDAGVKLPAEWPDSLHAADRGPPDIGALPLGAAMLRVGPAAR